MPVQRGDRFRLRRSSAQNVTIVGYAPSHTMGVTAIVPAGTVVVALDQEPGARAFRCYPENYEAVEAELVPGETRAGNYVSYCLTFAEREIGGLLEPMEPVVPRPPNRLPRGGE